MKVKEDRSLVMYILLSIVTCGIYSYYFLYSIAQDANVVCADDGKKTSGLAAFILLLILRILKLGILPEITPLWAFGNDFSSFQAVC